MEQQEQSSINTLPHNEVFIARIYESSNNSKPTMIGFRIQVYAAL